MKKAALVAIGIAWVGCSGSTGGTLSVQQNISAGFDATYNLNDQWARIKVSYRASTDNIFPEYVITTSLGTTLIHEGQMLDKAPAKEAIDPRAAVGGFVELTPADAEYPLVHGLFDGLMALGVDPRPSVEQLATPLYAAAFTSAQVLGLREMRSAFGMTEDEFQQVQKEVITFPVFPYPNHADLQKDKLKSLIGDIWAISGENHVVPGLDQCCGTCNNCYNCWWPGTAACGDWCAAGDHCNAYHGSGCGSISTWPGHCPHQDGSAYGGNAYNYCYNHTCGWTAWPCY